METAAIVAAAGRGERMGPGVLKPLRPLGGVPILVHALTGLTAAASVGRVVVAAPPDAVEEMRRLLAAYPFDAAVDVVPGGADRVATVALALAGLPADVDVVLVHDAARPLVSPRLVDAVAATVRAGAPACVPALPVADTIKEIRAPAADSDGAGATMGQVIRTPDRAGLCAVQTPQGFRRDVLVKAHEAAIGRAGSATDDAGLVERLGITVEVIAGDPEAFKITRPIDLLLGEAILSERRKAAP